MSVCKECGAEVIWRKDDLYWQCFNEDGVTIHWNACSQRRWQQVKATGTRFETEFTSGYADSIHGTKFDRISTLPVRGKNYKPTGFCLGCIPPWEVCPNGCPDAFA